MSGSRSGFSIVISATDSASRQIDAINKRLAAMRAPVERVQRSLAKFADLSGITTLSHGMSNLARTSLQAFENMGRMVPALGAITGAASIAGIMRLTSSWAEATTQLANAAQRAGVTTPELQRLENAARLAGVSGDALASGMRGLKDNLVNMVAGRAPGAVAMFNTLEVAWRNADGSARNVSEVLPELANKIAAIRDPTLQARAATDAFGGAGEALLPFLRQGAAGIAELTREAQAHGIMTERQVQAARDLNKAQVALRESVEGLGNSIAATLAPTLRPMLESMSRWIDANRDWIATGLSEKVNEFAGFVKSIDWIAVEKGITEFGQGANAAAKAVGGWQNVIEGLFALMAARFAITMITPFVTLGAAILKAGEGLAALGKLAAPTWLGPLTLALQAYNDFRNPPQLAPSSWPSNSPFWRDMPGSTLRDNPNSPLYAGPTGAERALQAAQDWLHGAPRGIRNNNPLNLGYSPDQGATGSDGRFGTFKSMQEGVAAADRQLLKYQDRDHINTLSGILAKWAPGSENDTGAYVNDVAKQIGVDPNAPINLHDRAMMAAMNEAMARHETGRALASADAWGATDLVLGPRPEQPDQQLFAPSAQGAPQPMAPATNVGGGTGAPPPAVSTTQTVKGSANVNIRLSGAPAGTKVTSTTDGDLFSGPPRVQQSMAGTGP